MPSRASARRVDRALRIVLSIALVAAGAFVALFCVGLYFVADCGAGCRANGEHAPVYAGFGAGIGLLLAGFLAPHGWRVALSGGAALGGGVAFSWSLFALGEEGGLVWGSACAGLVVAIAGAASLRRRDRA